VFRGGTHRHRTDQTIDLATSKKEATLRRTAMKMIALVSFLSLCVGVATAQKSKCVPTTTPPRDKSVRLQLTTKIVDARNSVEYGSRLLTLTLNLNYLNTGTRAILLDKKSSLIYRRLVSKNTKSVSACKYLSDITAHFMGAASLRNGPPERSEFVMLKPEESITLQNEMRVSRYDGPKDRKDALQAGD
jgi:hypothetical protein